MTDQRGRKTDSLLLTTTFPPEPGGVARLLGQIARARQGKTLVLTPETSAVARADASGSTDSHVQVHGIRLQHTGLMGRLGYRLLWSVHPCVYYLWHFWRPALALARQPGVSTVQVGHLYLGLVALALRLARGLPYAVYAHGQELHPAAGTRLRPLDRLIRGLVLRRAAAVFAHSNYTGNQVLRWGVSPRRIVRLPVGGSTTDSRTALPSAPGPASALPASPPPAPGSNPSLLTVARLVPRKGVDTVLAALPRVLGHFPGLEYVVVGDGPDLPRLQTLVRQYELEAHVRFQGEVDDARLADCYAACDIFLMPAREESGEVEGFGLVFLEAARFGKPSIAGRSGGQPDAVLDGQTGLLVDPSEPREIAEAILRLLNNPALRARLGRQARARAETEYTWERAAGVVDAVLDQASRGQ